MRPTGGVIGGVSTFEVGNEHQQHGTPHGHGQAHVVCIYQYSTLRTIADKIEHAWNNNKDASLVHAMKVYHEWLHVEKPLDMEMYTACKNVAEEHFFSGFAASQHTPLCQTPAYLQDDADRKDKSIWTKLCAEPEQLAEQESEGRNFAQQYMRDCEWVSSRVQHHVHRNRIES